MVVSMEQRQPKMVIDRWDRVFKAVSAEPRRQLIVALNDVPAGEWIALPDAAISPNVAPETNLDIELQHHHLPMLEEYEYIRWTPEPFRARRGPYFEDLAVVFDALHHHAQQIPDRLVYGCRRLEEECQKNDM